ncbi:hypothetical protein [Nonomuraea sp. NPDC050786]|uniref:hypothetical protein n=1 Tax=Nonomuraea sp. NPDC050786 TaxID=3154840 RepID=UPI0033FA0C44
MGQPEVPPRWEVATDPAEVHNLLIASDAEQGSRYAIAPPQRNLSSTMRRVEAGEVHLLRIGAEPAAAFTLSADPPFELGAGLFPPAVAPLYLSRLCVSPKHLRAGSLVGVRCLREAIRMAENADADALRSQANPDFTDVLDMLTLHGFRPWGPIATHGPLRSVNMQKDLAVTTTRATFRRA